MYVLNRSLRYFILNWSFAKPSSGLDLEVKQNTTYDSKFIKSSREL